ncbi:PH domain-containing protein [uncultured Ruminococcus sp.]|uniref:PH domain-containing protein n=1 Tax=uncultured Ruminococcus sp. TaxID=165186 RepID=UPI0025CD0441|nr:PH domain-containing protein [uncultured Ruminococcus sp.]
MAKGKTKDGLEYLWTDKKRTLFGLPLSFTRYYLTESRLITRVGLLTVVEDELDIYRINDKKMELPLGQRLFGCGTIILFSKDVDTPEKHIHSIKNPRDVSDLITALINEQRDRFGIRGRDMMGPAGMPPEAWGDNDCCND